ncbi:MAG: indole-3-glycerol phosphate synthase TrpC [Planctomycetia bacterium]|nr:indole-3-glycerol phosphate synthase TrpC [Planctomycetia bacterium]
MPTILDQIVRDKREEIKAARAQLSESALEQSLASVKVEPVTTHYPSRFHRSLKETNFIRIIAEVKRQSPSAGAIQANADAITFARTYAECGAACISVLTDTPHFGGSLDDLRKVRAEVNTPLLRKDFILERYQVLQAKAAGADAVLLIAEILDDATLAHLILEIQSWGMDALVECYEAANVPRVLAAGATLIGINNRNLHTFEVNLSHTLALAQQIPASCTVISESGIKTRADVETLAAAGIKAILVGETLMKATDVKTAFEQLGTVPFHFLPSPRVGEGLGVRGFCR